MDLTAIFAVVGLIGLGAGLVAWPLALHLELKNREIRRLKTLLGEARDAEEGQAEAIDTIVQTERDLERLADLPPPERARVLFRGPGPEASSGQASGSGSKEDQ